MFSCVLRVSQQELCSLWCELQRDRPELLSVLEGVLVYAVSHLQDSIRERDSLEQALHRSSFLLHSIHKLCPVSMVSDCVRFYTVIPSTYLHSVLDGKVNTIRSFGPYMKKWRTRLEKRERNALLRYRRVLFSPNLSHLVRLIVIKTIQ